MNAAGHYIPPMLLFPRIRSNDDYMIGAPLHSISGFNKTGWMTKELFTKWMIHFIHFAKPSRTRRVFLLLDGHSTHIKNIDAINFAKDNYIDIICFPPHTSHRLQPLDVSFMSPLKSYCNKGLSHMVIQREYVRLRDLAGIFAKAYENAATLSIAKNGFRKTGIVPINRHIFTEEDFAPSMPTERIHSNSMLLIINAYTFNNIFIF